MDALLQDVRYAARGLTRSPGFTVIAVLCLVLGIGINSLVFSLADGVTLRPLPFRDPERLAALYSTQLAADRNPVSYPDYRDWKEQARSLSDLAAHAYRSFSITEGVESERFQGSAVSANLFSLLGEQPVLGRPFSADDDRPGAAAVVMLSHGLWERRYAGDPALVGRAVIMDGVAHTVIGVMPPRFAFPQVSELWVPLAALEHTSPRAERRLYPVARLAAGASLESVTSELRDIAAALARAHRENEGWSARAGSLHDELMPVQLRVAMTAMLGAVTLVLLIACANVASLLVARASSRQREMAVRQSLGAGPVRLVRQLLTESALLVFLSLPLGLLIAHAGLELMLAAVPPTVMVPYYIDWSVNTRVLVYTMAVAAATTFVFGLAPAARAGRTDLIGMLKEGGHGAGGRRARSRLRSALVVAEVALSLVLLVGASLFVRSSLNIVNADPGFDTSRLMTMRVFIPGEAYANPDDITARMNDVVQRLEALPGVTAAFASNLTPFFGGAASAGIVAESVTVAPGEQPRVTSFGTTAHGLATLGQRLLVGRNFSDAEASTRSGVAIVNGALASRVWPGQGDPVGRRFRFAADPADRWFTVIGVVSNFQPLILRDKELVEPLAIVPFPYHAARDTGLTIRVADFEPASITAAARQAISSADPALALFNVQTGDENREGRLWAPLFLTWMFTIFGGVALFLAAIGLYGVLSYSVAQRTHEFGIRTALGATRQNILTLVMAHGVRLAAVGIALGMLGAFAVTRAVRTLLYNVTSSDPASFGVTVLALAAITVLAGCVPAWRATHVDPIVALREE